MKRYSVLVAFVILLCFSACKNEKQIGRAYTIDPAVKNEVEKKTITSGGVSLGTIEFKLYENDSMVANTKGMLKSPECLTIPDLKADTISITGYFGMTAGIGYQISLFKDTCIITHFSNTDVPIYKLHQSDSASFGVSVPCKKYTLTLSERPTFKKDEVIDGIVCLTSEEYYEIDNGVTKKLRVELTGYFTTGPLGSLEERYNKRQKQ